MSRHVRGLHVDAGVGAACKLARVRLPVTVPQDAEGDAGYTEEATSIDITVENGYIRRLRTKP